MLRASEGDPSSVPDPPAPSPMDGAMAKGTSSFSSTVIRRTGSEEQQKVMSRVEEAVLRLYQRRIEEASTASTELEGMQRHVANQIKRIDMSMRKVATPFEKALEAEEVRRAELIRRVNAKFQRVRESIKAAQAAAQEDYSHHFKDLTAANEVIRVAQASLSMAMKGPSKSAFIEGFRSLMDSATAAIEQGRKCSIEGVQAADDALDKAAAQATVRRILNELGMSNVVIKVKGERRERGEAVGASGKDEAVSRTHPHREKRTASTATSHVEGHPHPRARDRHGEVLPLDSPPISRHDGSSVPHKAGYSSLHQHKRRRRDLPSQDKEERRRARAAASECVKDDIIRDLLRNYEELEELYRLAIIEKRAAQSGILHDQCPSQQRPGPATRLSPQRQHKLKCPTSPMQRPSAATLSQRVAHNLLRLASPSRRPAPTSQASSARRASNSFLRPIAWPKSTHCQDAPSDTPTHSSSSPSSSWPSNSDVAEMLGHPCPRRGPATSPPSSVASSPPSSLAPPSPSPVSHEGDDRFTLLLNKLEHVEAMLGDISSSDAGSSPMETDRRRPSTRRKAEEETGSRQQGLVKGGKGGSSALDEQVGQIDSILLAR